VTTGRIHQRLQAVFDEATVQGLIETNPAPVAHVSLERKPEHFPSLPYARMPSFIGELRQVQGTAAWTWSS
jgi:hypothetical protein